MSRKKEDAVVSPNEAEAHMIVKAMRIYLGLTQPEVAKKVGISASTYSSYENAPGELLRAPFCVVYKILEVVHLNPKKFMQGKYVLDDLGRQITTLHTGRISHILLKMIRNNCPVTLKEEGDENGRQ